MEKIYDISKYKKESPYMYYMQKLTHKGSFLRRNNLGTPELKNLYNFFKINFNLENNTQNYFKIILI